MIVIGNLCYHNNMGIKLQEVTVPGCIDCARFKKLWEEKLAQEFPDVEFEEIDATVEGGQDILVQYGIMASPGIIINDELFSTGRVSEDKLRSKLQELLAQG